MRQNLPLIRITDAQNGPGKLPVRLLGEADLGLKMGPKCLQNDLLGLKMARNGAGNGKNGLETTKCAKKWRKRAKTRGNCPRSDVRGRRSGKPQSVSIRVHPWLGFGLICPRSEVRGRRSEKVYLREFASICGRFSAGRGLRRQRMPKNGSQRAWAG